MPITPFHFGPGLLFKAVAPRQVSFTAFIAANVAIDSESLYNLVSGRWPVHRMLHTFGLGSLVGVAVGLLVYVLGRRFLNTRSGKILREEFSWSASIIGGLLGGVSHSLLDAIMHSDMQPLRPFTEGNPLLGMMGLGVLHLGCLLAGAVGAAWLLLRHRRSTAAA